MLLAVVGLAIAGAQYYSAKEGGEAANESALDQAESDIYEAAYNRHLREMEADSVMSAALKTVEDTEAQASQIKATQAASYASSGVVVGVGSAQAILDETDRLAREDSLIAIDNAVRKSESIRLGARLEQEATLNNATNMVNNTRAQTASSLQSARINLGGAFASAYVAGSSSGAKAGTTTTPGVGTPAHGAMGARS